eukprot:2075654-Pyramimonas_sp.AAC.1
METPGSTKSEEPNVIAMPWHNIAQHTKCKTCCHRNVIILRDYRHSNGPTNDARFFNIQGTSCYSVALT